MHAALAGGHKAAVGRPLQRGLGQGGVHRGVPGIAQAAQGHAGAVIGGLLLGRAGHPEFQAERHQVVERGLGAGVRLVGAVAQPHQPVAGMALVVARFLQRLGGDAGQMRVGAVLQRGPERHGEGAEQEVAHHRGGEVAVGARGAGQRAVVRQLSQGVVAEFVRVAEIGQRVFGQHTAVAGAPQVCKTGGFTGVGLDAAGGVLVQQAGQTEMVQAVVGQRQVFLQDGAVATPLGIALAQHQGVVGQLQQVVDRRRAGCGFDGGSGVHHMCPTRSGIS